MSTDVPINEMSDEEQSLNHRALQSTIGWDRDWQINLAALLRSDAPIGRAVREELANCIDGNSSSGIRFTLSGHEASSRWWASIDDRREWYEFGLKVFPFVEESMNLPEAFENAAEALGKSEAYCKKAYYYRRDCDQWTANAVTQGDLYKAMSKKQLALEFHWASVEQKRSKPVPMTGSEFDAWFRERKDALTHLVGELDLGGWQSQALLNFLYWKWRVPTNSE